MANIANLNVVLSATAAGFHATMSKAEGTLHRFLGRFEGLNASLGRFNLEHVAEESLHAFMDQETALAKLNAVLAATGGAAGVTSAQMQHLAEQMRETTKFGDATTISAEAIMATFHNIKGDNFAEAIHASADLATILGMDLPSAAKLLGKALNAPEQGMARLHKKGVAFTEAQTAMVKQMTAAGDIAGAQKVIFEALKESYGGAAEAAGNTLAGAMAQLENTTHELMVKIGEGLAPALRAVNVLAKDLVQSISSHGEGIARFARALLIGAVAIEAVRRTIQLLGIAERATAAAQAFLLGLSGPAGWIALAAGVTAATLAVSLMNQALDRVEASAKKAAAAAARLPAAMVNPKGLLERGNLDLFNRPQVFNPKEGGISTVWSMSFEEDNKQILIPRISLLGKILSIEEAIDEFHRTHQHLGIFDTVEHANAYAEALHRQQEASLNLGSASGPHFAPDHFDEAVLKRQEEMARRGNEIFSETRTAGEKLSLTLGELRNELAGGYIGWDTYSRAVARARSEADQFGAHVRDFEGELQKQIATFGMSANVARIYEMELEGVDHATITYLYSLNRQLDALEEQKQAHEDAERTLEKMTSDAQSLWESVLTPAEKYALQLEKIQVLLDAGLDPEIAKRAAEQARAGLFKGSHELPSGPAAVERRFTEGTPGSRRENRVERNTDVIAVESKKQTGLLNTISLQPRIGDFALTVSGV